MGQKPLTVLTCRPENSLYPTNVHCILQHSCQSEGHLLREVIASHGDLVQTSVICYAFLRGREGSYFKAVPVINMNDSTVFTAEKNIAGMAITKTEDVADAERMLANFERLMAIATNIEDTANVLEKTDRRSSHASDVLLLSQRIL